MILPTLIVVSNINLNSWPVSTLVIDYATLTWEGNKKLLRKKKNLDNSVLLTLAFVD